MYKIISNRRGTLTRQRAIIESDSSSSEGESNDEVLYRHGVSGESSVDVSGHNTEFNSPEPPKGLPESGGPP